MPEVIRCQTCLARGFREDGLAHDDCTECLGFGWRWPDGKPPTLCAGDAGLKHGAYSLPCGRTDAKCQGCGRARHEIGGPGDVQTTIVRRPWLVSG